MRSLSITFTACATAWVFGCSPQPDAGGSAPPTEGPRALGSPEVGMVEVAVMPSPDPSALAECEREGGPGEPKLWACVGRSLIDFQAPTGVTHKDAIMAALGQTMSAYHRLFGLSMIPGEHRDARSEDGSVSMSHYTMSEEDNPLVVTPVVVASVSQGAQLRVLWCVAEQAGDSAALAAIDSWCEAALWTLIQRPDTAPAPAGPTMGECNEPCKPYEPGELAASLEVLSPIVDELCGCGDDQACKDQAMALFHQWGENEGSSTDPGTHEDAMRLGELIERMLGCL